MCVFEVKEQSNDEHGEMRRTIMKTIRARVGKAVVPVCGLGSSKDPPPLTPPP